MKLRVWHIINFPREAFRFEVPDTKTAISFLDALAKYDLFLGDGTDKPWTTVGDRLKEREKLAKETGEDRLARRMFRLYEAYQLEHCPGGVPLVVTNVQGCEMFEDDEWCEFYDENGDDIGTLRHAHA